jgi:hypothetical protein
MLPYKYEVLRPYLIDGTRLALLSSGTDYGSIKFGDEYILDRLDAFSERISDDNIHNFYRTLRSSRSMPDPDRFELDKTLVASDIQFKDIFRQHKELETRCNRGRVNISHIRMIADPSLKYHWASSRGFERHVIGHMNLLDSEMINRRSVIF